MSSLTDKPKEKYPFVTTEITLFLFSLALFTNLPAMNNLILTKMCYEKFKDMDFCQNTSNPNIGDDDYIQSHVATYSIYNTIAYFIPACFAAIMAGSWGDKFDRKFPLLIPPCGQIITSTSFALFAYYLKEAPTWIFPIISIPGGLAGGEVIVISSSIAYVVAISDQENRIRKISIMQAMIVIPSTIGPQISLALKYHFGSPSVFFFSTGLGVLTLLYNIFFLKPNYPEKVEKKTLKNLMNIQHIVASAKVIFRPRKNNRRKYIILMLTAMFCYFFVFSGKFCVLFFKEKLPI